MVTQDVPIMPASVKVLGCMATGCHSPVMLDISKHQEIWTEHAWLMAHGMDLSSTVIVGIFITVIKSFGIYAFIL